MSKPEITIRKATVEDLPFIAETIPLVIAFMRQIGNEQWDDTYPLVSDFTEDIHNGTCYMFLVNGASAGFLTLDQFQRDCYLNVKWGHDDSIYPAFIVHRFCVNPAFHGLGIARAMLPLVEATAKSLGGGQIRIDSYSKNGRMLYTIETSGYTQRGYFMNPARPLPYHCYDKLI